MKKEEGIKNLFKNYLFFISMIPYLDQKIDIQEYKLAGVSSIRFDKQHGSTNQEFINQKKLEMMDELELYTQFKLLCQTATKVLRIMFDKLTPEEKKTVSDLYIFESKKYDEASKEKEMSQSGLHKQVTKTFEEMI